MSKLVINGIEYVPASDAVAKPDNLLRKGLSQALRGIANGFDKRRPWSRPDPLIMRTLRRAADELDKEDV